MVVPCPALQLQRLQQLLLPLQQLAASPHGVACPPSHAVPAAAIHNNKATAYCQHTVYATPCCLHGVHAGGHLLKALTSRSCSCVFEAPPKSWFTSAPIALEGPAPSEPLHMSEPVTRVRRAMVLVFCCCLLLLTCNS